MEKIMYIKKNEISFGSTIFRVLQKVLHVTISNSMLNFSKIAPETTKPVSCHHAQTMNDHDDVKQIKIYQ